MKLLIVLLFITLTAHAEQTKITLGEINWPLDESAAEFTALMPGFWVQRP